MYFADEETETKGGKYFAQDYIVSKWQRHD